MPLLKAKAEKSTTISIRVPESAKKDLDMVKSTAESKGLDPSGSLTDVVVKWIKQAKEELAASKTTAVASVAPESFPNGGTK